MASRQTPASPFHGLLRLPHLLRFCLRPPALWLTSGVAGLCLALPYADLFVRLLLLLLAVILLRIMFHLYRVLEAGAAIGSAGQVQPGTRVTQPPEQLPEQLPGQSAEQPAGQMTGQKEVQKTGKGAGQTASGQGPLRAGGMSMQHGGQPNPAGADKGEDANQERRKVAADKALAEKLRLYNTLINDNRDASALAELRHVSREFPDNLALRQQLLQLAFRVGDQDVQLQETNWLLYRHLRAGRGEEGVKVYLDYLARYPGYRPAAAELVGPLARALRSNGHVGEAMDLVSGFHERFPGHAQTPPVYLLAAQILLEEAGRPAQARRIVCYVLRHFPDNAWQAQLQALLQRLEQRDGQRGE